MIKFTSLQRPVEGAWEQGYIYSSFDLPLLFLLTFLELLHLFFKLGEVGGVHLILSVCNLKISDPLLQCLLLFSKQL